MDGLRSFLTYDAPLRELRAREVSPIIPSEARHEAPLKSEFIIWSRLDRAGIEKVESP